MIQDKRIVLLDGAMGPAAFAEGIARCIEAGARIVGGCCGTTPEHIRAVRRKIDQM